MKSSCATKPNDVESYDLRELDVPYMVFASRDRSCYRPVHGVSSIVKVTDGTAWTVGIFDQPENQTAEEFLRKVKSHLTASK